MPFFSDYGNYLHGSTPFSSQYYSQLLQPYPGSNAGSRAMPRAHAARNYNAMVVEQTLRAIRRGPNAVAARHYARPVHVNASEIDVTSPRRPRHTAAIETSVDGVGTSGSTIHRGRTVVRLHTNKSNSKRPETRAENRPEPVAVTTIAAEPLVVASSAMLMQELDEGLAKKGTIKRHTSAGVKVPVNDDRRPSAVTDEIMREQEALFDTMIMEEMEGQEKRVRRKSYPVDTGGGGGGGGGGGKNKKSRETRKKSMDAAMVYGERVEKPAKSKASSTCNWKLNYDVIIEESGIEPVSFTFKLNNKTKKESGDNGKLDANHNVVMRKSHDNDNDRVKKNHSNKKHAKTVTINKNQNNNNDSSEGAAAVAVGVPADKQPKAGNKKIVVKKKVVKKKKPEEKEQEKEAQKEDRARNRQDKRELLQKKKKTSKKGDSSNAAVAAAAAVTPFVRASFGKTFISPSQVSSTKSKFEKTKSKINLEKPTSPPPPPVTETVPVAESSSDEDESSGDDDTSSSSTSLCSGSSGSTFYDSDDYGDKRVACSNSSFDSGLPSSPVPAPDPIGRNSTTLTPHKIISHNIYYYTTTTQSTRCCKGQFENVFKILSTLFWTYSNTFYYIHKIYRDVFKGIIQGV